MALKHIYKRKWLLVPLLGLIILGVVVLGINLFLKHPPFQRYLLTRIASGSGYTLQADDFGVRYNNGIEFWATGLDVKARTSQSQLTADKTALFIDVKSLLKGRWVPRRLEMEGSQFNLTSEDPAFSPSPAPDTGRKPSIKPIPWESIVSKIPADIHLSQVAVNIDHITYQLQNTDVKVGKSPRNPDLRDVVLSGQITSPSGNAVINVNGWVTPTDQAKDDKYGILHVTIDPLPLSHFHPSNTIQFQNGLATLTADIAITTSGIIIPNGLAKFTTPQLTVQKGSRKKTYTLEEASLNFDARLAPTGISLNSATLKTPQATLLSSFHYNWAHSDGPQMAFSISSDPLPMDTFKELFPDIVIPGWITTEIFPMFTTGGVKLEKFALKGPMAAIQRLGRKENEDCLYLDARIIETMAFQERPGPIVNHVSGRIQIKEGAFIISEVSGQTGDSNLTHSGYTIPDLYEYPAQHIIALAGDFDLTDIKAWHAQTVLPKVLRNQLASFGTFAGRANGNATITLKGPKAQGITGNIDLVKSTIDRADILLPLTIKQGWIQIPPDSAASLTASGHWGKNRVDIDGAMDLNHFLLGLPRRYDDTAELTAQWDLTELIQTVKQHDFGPDWLLRVKKVDGLIQSNLTLHKTAQHKGWQYDGGTFEWQKVNLDHPFLKKPVTTQSGRLSLSEDGAGQYDIDGRWGQSPFDLSGRFDDFFRSWSTQGQTQLSTNDLATVLNGSKFPVISATKPVPVDLIFDQTEGNWSLFTNLALDGQKIAVGDFTFAPLAKGNRLQSQLAYQKGRPLEIKKLQWHTQKKRLNVQGNFALEGNQPTRLKLSTKDFPLDQMGLSYKQQSNKLAGKLNSEIDITITGNRLETLSINGPLRINDTQLPVANTPLLKSGWDVDIVFNGARTTVQPSTFPLATGEQLQISGVLSGWKEISGNLTVTLDRLYLDRWTQRFKTSKDTNTKDRQPSKPKPTPWVMTPNLDITLFTPTVLWQNRSIGELNAALRWNGYDGYIDAVDLEAPGVTVNMSGRYGWPLSDQSGLSLLTYIHLSDIESDRLLSGIGVKKNDIHGTLNLEGGLEIRGKTGREMAQTASGRFKLALKDGFIRESNILIKVLELISLENIFIKKPPDAMKDQFFYKSIDADFVLEKGILTTENFFMKSPVFNMGATGKLDMSNMNLNLLLAAQPLNTLDAIVSRVPIAGHILTGKNKALLVYTFEVDGTLGAPRVHQKPFKNLDKAVVGYFQRIFFTPTRVFSQVGNYLKEITERIKTGRPDSQENGGDH